MLCWGELGMEPGQDLGSQSVEVLKGEKIQHLCSRDGFTVFVLENGKVYTRVSGQKQKTQPGQLAAFKKQKIHFADSGTSHILFLSETGNVFHSEVKSKESAAKSKDFSIVKPQIFKSLSETNIIQVACGNNHSLALSKDGRLFAWGQNTYGQLGLGTEDLSQCNPQCVKSLTGVPVAQITAGGEHSFAMSLSGTVFGWGRNNHGQLGLNDTEDKHNPNYVKLLECKKTIHVSCGEEHTAVLTKDGLVFTFGAGSYGQLGHNSTKDEIKPRFVAELFGNKVSQIACGSYHTLVFVASSGKIYSFGRGEKGQLGNGRTSDQLVPLPVTVMGNNGPENGRTTKPAVKRIFAGGNQGFAEFCDEVDLVSSIDQSSLNTLKRIMTVDNLLGKELCKNTKKAILQAFSATQTLNGSFLEVSKDNHFKTSQADRSGLDMSKVNLTFKKLAENSSMLQQVTAAVQNNLIPSLPKSPACVEAMRVYIILPALIMLEEQKDLTKLNRAILSLEKSHFKILECWWTTMPSKFFVRLVKMYKKESHRLLQLAMVDSSGDYSKLHDSLKILQALYKVNSSRYANIEERHFCIPVMEMFTDFLTLMERQGVPLFQPFVQFEQCIVALRMINKQLIPYPCIFDMDTKLKLLNLGSMILQRQPFILELQVTRTAILQDTLECLRSHRSAAHYTPLQVKFKDEPCIGHGVSQEFFTLFSRELYNDRGIFELADESGLLWFPSWKKYTQEPEMDDVFHRVGILCGLAVSNGFLSNFHFPLALYKKLLHVQPTLEDLKELSPTEGNSLQELLDYEYDDVEDKFCQDFNVTMETAAGHKIPHELIPDGNKTPVQKHNRKQFVDAYVNHVFNTSVEKQFKAFSQGFRSSFALPIVDVFLPDELRAVIHGNTNYEWELLEQPF
ncbi:probable E3 ubiquitin-protein ligase HERC4 isoform X2 [Heptranchias perlo]|uniref:probable E3 ubiquitin-protein ligase HERC4 isoform X2 n=1 Tax=Heptranchias perlo TaxID=212740 RepID=UPI00355A67AA